MIREAVRLQETGDLILMIADLHAITVPQEAQLLRKNIMDLSAWLLAAGLDDKRSHLFVQSENPDHTYLSWILSCNTQMGELERMTQFKDKSRKQGERTSLGLFSYPVLQAVDVLLYDADIVPVGEDQKQHIELMRDIARKFNNKYGKIFKEPRAQIKKDVARIMSLTDPDKKMSKSDANLSSAIFLIDSPETIHKKIARAVTDSSTSVNKTDHAFGTRGGVQNLLTIYASLKDISYADALTFFDGKTYAEFKKGIAEAIISETDGLKRNYLNLMNDLPQINNFLNNGRKYTNDISSVKITAVKNAVGLGR